jgi:thioesterase domain-containing protein
MDQDFAAWRAALEALWTEGIPQAAALGAVIRRLDATGLELAAPLAPNRNHMGSAYGGSLQSLATLAGWGVALLASGSIGPHQILIRKAQMRFMAPVTTELLATARMPDPGVSAAFRTRLAERGHGRLEVGVDVRGHEGPVAARFYGEFIALDPGR